VEDSITPGEVVRLLFYGEYHQFLVLASLSAGISTNTLFTAAFIVGGAKMHCTACVAGLKRTYSPE